MNGSTARTTASRSQFFFFPPRILARPPRCLSVLVLRCTPCPVVHVQCVVTRPVLLSPPPPPSPPPRIHRLATARIYDLRIHEARSTLVPHSQVIHPLIPILTSALHVHTLHTRPLFRSPRASPACSFLSPVCLLWHLWYTSTTHLRTQHLARSNQCVLRLSVRPSPSRSLS